MYKLIHLFFITNSIFAQQAKTIDLYAWQAQGKLSIVNREVERIDETRNRFIRLSEKSGEGLVWLPLSDFKNGVIEIEMRGKDVLQRSFIGIAFHALNDSTYDAVYCRPFNFFAKDSLRKIHAIQYISHPVFTWRKLREERNGVFEKEIISPPNPNGWFTLKLVVNNKSIQAFINQSRNPSLIVEKISDVVSGRIGIFVGDGSGGDFKNVKVRYSK
jgi:hypothetical protein